MKDIDFDELDRAVNSLMSTVPGDEPTAASTAQKTATDDSVMLGAQTEIRTETANAETLSVLDLDAPMVSSEDDLLQTQQPESIVSEEVEKPEEASALAPSQPRGRFMDVMRPASRDNRRVALSSTVSRQGPVLQPTANTAEVQEDTFSDAAIEDTAKQGDANSSLDMTPDFEDALSGFTDEIAPQSSPFLADAKVEKRPLGRPADAAPTVDLAAELAAESAVEPAMEPVAVPAEQPLESFDDDSISPNKDAQLPEQPLPAELGSELLSIETSTDHLPAEPEVVQQPAYRPKPTPTPTPTPVSAPMPTHNPMPITTPNRAMEVTSIPQQYKVQPQQSEEASAGAIYDSQPLAHPAEKKPGWLWVVAILGILLLGAGAGAAVYYLGLL